MTDLTGILKTPALDITKCSCGACVKIGDPIMFNDGVNGCAACDFGAAPVVSGWENCYADMLAAQAVVDAHFAGRARLTKGRLAAAWRRANETSAMYRRLTGEQVDATRAAA